MDGNAGKLRQASQPQELEASWCEQLQKLGSNMNFHRKFRDAICQYFQLLSSVCDSIDSEGANPKMLLNNWMMKLKAGSTERSVLDMGLSLKKLVEKLETALGHIKTCQPEYCGNYVLFFEQAEEFEDANVCTFNWEFYRRVIHMEVTDRFLQIVDDADQALLNQIWEKFFLETLNLKPKGDAATATDTSSSKSLMASLVRVPPQQVHAICNDTSSVLSGAVQSGERRRFPQDELVQLLWRFLHGRNLTAGDGIEETVKIVASRSGFLRADLGEDATEPVSWSGASLLQAVRVYAYASVAGDLCIFFAHAFLDRKDKIMDAAGDLDKRIVNLACHLETVLDDIASEADAAHSACTGAFFVSVPLVEVKAWAERVRAALPAFYKFTLKVALQAALTSATTVGDEAPTWRHFLSDDRFYKKSAESSVFNHPKVDTFSADLVQVYRRWEQVKQLGKYWLELDVLQEGGEFFERAQELRTQVEELQKTNSVISGLKVVLQMTTGDEQYRAAQNLLSKQTFSVPATLTKALQKLAAKATDESVKPPAAKRRRRVKMSSAVF